MTWKRDAARSSMQAPAWQKLSTGLHNIGGNILHINIFCKITDKKASKLVVFRAFISINIKKKRITVVICRISFCEACGTWGYTWALTIDCSQMPDHWSEKKTGSGVRLKIAGIFEVNKSAMLGPKKIFRGM